MNNVEKIKYLRELETQKDELERKLVPITRNIQQEKNSCSHISVDLGCYGLYPSTGNKYRCLICGKGKSDEYFYETQYIVYAENYLPQYNIKNEQECDIKFDHIQTLALGLLKENPDMSREELVNKLNNLIQESISFRENENVHKLVKNKTPRK